MEQAPPPWVAGLLHRGLAPIGSSLEAQLGCGCIFIDLGDNVGSASASTLPSPPRHPSRSPWLARPHPPIHPLSSSGIAILCDTSHSRDPIAAGRKQVSRSRLAHVIVWFGVVGGRWFRRPRCSIDYTGKYSIVTIADWVDPAMQAEQGSINTLQTYHHRFRRVRRHTLANVSRYVSVLPCGLLWFCLSLYFFSFLCVSSLSLSLSLSLSFFLLVYFLMA